MSAGTGALFAAPPDITFDFPDDSDGRSAPTRGDVATNFPEGIGHIRMRCAFEVVILSPNSLQRWQSWAPTLVVAIEGR
jgi:hypothetical protein